MLVSMLVRLDHQRRRRRRRQQPAEGHQRQVSGADAAGPPGDGTGGPPVG